jgi:hypothetical protein
MVVRGARGHGQSDGWAHRVRWFKKMTAGQPLPRFEFLWF